MKHIFHCTSWDNYQSILKNGFQPVDTVWNVSDPEKMYFFELGRFCDCQGHDLESEEEDDVIDCLIDDIMWNGTYAAAIQNFQGERLVVIEMIVPDGIVEDDNSCQFEQACQIDKKHLNISMISRVYASDHYRPSLRLMYVCAACNNSMSTCDDVFDSVELEIVRSLNYSNFCDSLNESMNGHHYLLETFPGSLTPVPQ